MIHKVLLPFIFLILPFLSNAEDSILRFELLEIPPPKAVVDSSCLDIQENITPIVETEEERVEGLTRSSDRRKPWFFFVVTLQLCLLSMVKWFFPKHIDMALKSFSNLNLAAYQFREEKGEGSFFKIFLNINFILSLGLFLSTAIDFFNYKPALNPFAFFCILIILLSLVYLLKYLQYLITALILPIQSTTEFFQFTYFAVMRILGVVLIPANLILYYSSQNISSIFFYSLLSLVVFFIFYRIARGLSICQNIIQKNRVHFFLYICSLEIVPAALLLKFLSGFF